MAKKKLTRRQRQLTDPGRRSKLPDSELPPDLLAKRRLNARLNAPFVEGSPLKYRDVARDRNAETALRYGPQEQQLAQRQQNIGPWFDQFKADVASKNQAYQAMNAQAVTDVQNRTAATQQATVAQTGKMDEQARADAASRGATYSGQPGQQAQAGATVTQALGNLSADLLRALGASYGGHAGEQAVIGSAAQLGERLKAQKDSENLQADKGAYGEAYMAKRRDAESQGVLERAAFDVKADTAANVETDRRQRRITARKKVTTAEEKDAYQRANKLGPYKPAAAPKKPKQTEAALKMKGTIRTGVRLVQKGDNGLASFWNDAFDRLVEHDKLDPVIARAIVQGAQHGRLGAKTRKRLLDDYGITEAELGFAAKRPKRPAPYSPSQVGKPTAGLG